MNLLDEIVANKRAEIAKAKMGIPLALLCARAESTPQPLSLVGRLSSVPVGLIAEVKRRSPSKGVIRKDLVADDLARDYASAGAQALSVLMDQRYFGGGEQDFSDVRSAVDLPMLYKEFVVDPWQVWHAKSIGASAVLLIVGALSQTELEAFLSLCSEAGLEALVEVHDEKEMRRAIDAHAMFIGINNRDLKTFNVSLETTRNLAKLAPDGCFLISESGIHTSEDVRTVQQAGAKAVLVGESLLRQADVRAAVRQLMGEAWASL